MEQKYYNRSKSIIRTAKKSWARRNQKGAAAGVYKIIQGGIKACLDESGGPTTPEISRKIEHRNTPTATERQRRPREVWARARSLL